MKTTCSSLFYMILNFSFLTIGLNFASGQESDEAMIRDDYAYVYAYASDVKRTEINCYSCVSHIRNGHHSGIHSCDEPFREYGIPKQQCPGACGKIYTIVGDGEHTLHRVCLPNCSENSDASGFTECCYTELCNAAPSQGRRILLTVLYAVVMIVVLET